MDKSRLANVIFDRGQKITESRYKTICERIDNDAFTLDEYVVEYKAKDSFMGKLAFNLRDGSRVLVSEDTMTKLSSLNINRTHLEEHMGANLANFKQVIGIVTHGN